MRESQYFELFRFCSEKRVFHLAVGWFFCNFYELRSHRCLYCLATRHAPAGLRVTPKGRGGKLQTRQSGDFPPSPLRFHPKNPFLTSLPPFPRFGRWWLKGCFFLGRVLFCFFESVSAVIKNCGADEFAFSLFNFFVYRYTYFCLLNFYVGLMPIYQSCSYRKNCVSEGAGLLSLSKIRRGGGRRLRVLRSLFRKPFPPFPCLLPFLRSV